MLKTSVIRCRTRPSIAACLSKRAACSRKSCLAIFDRSARCVAPGRLTRTATDGGISRISSQSVSDRRRLKIGRCLKSVINLLYKRHDLSVDLSETSDEMDALIIRNLRDLDAASHRLYHHVQTQVATAI